MSSFLLLWTFSVVVEASRDLSQAILPSFYLASRDRFRGASNSRSNIMRSRIHWYSGDARIPPHALLFHLKLNWDYLHHCLDVFVIRFLSSWISSRWPWNKCSVALVPLSVCRSSCSSPSTKCGSVSGVSPNAIARICLVLKLHYVRTRQHLRFIEDAEKAQKHCIIGSDQLLEYSIFHIFRKFNVRKVLTCATVHFRRGVSEFLTR